MTGDPKVVEVRDFYLRLLKQRDDALTSIKNLVCGEAEPNWPNDLRVTGMRYRIADICDSVIRPSQAVTQQRSEK